MNYENHQRAVVSVQTEPQQFHRRKLVLLASERVPEC